MIIPFEEISRYTDLLSRILSGEFVRNKRFSQDIEKEFEKESWGLMLEMHQSEPELSLEEIENLFFDGEKKNIYFYKNKFRLATRNHIRNQFKNLVAEIITKEIKESESVLELGAGYGAILNWVSKKNSAKNCRFIGADMSTSGRKLIEAFGTLKNLNITSCRCDFFVPEIDRTNLGEVSLVFSSYALMYLSNFNTSFKEFLLSFKAETYIFIEPIYQDLDKLIHGDLCKKYMEDNCYNLTLITDLVDGFQATGKYELVSHIENIFGSNPFLPISILVFKKTSG